MEDVLHSNRAPTDPALVQVAFNKTASPYPRDATIHKLFEERACLAASGYAVVGAGVRWSYAHLDAYAGALARQVRAVTHPGAIVSVLVDRSPASIVALLGVLKAGCAYLPLSPRDPISWQQFQVRDCGSGAVIVQEGVDASHLPDQPVIPIANGVVRSASVEGAVESEAVATDLAYVMYTSGSTGRPKGVAVTHRNVVRLVQGVDYVSLSPDEVLLHCAPLAFDASTFEIWGALLNGGCVAVAPSGHLRLDELGEVIRNEGVTTVWLTAGLFSRMVDFELPALACARQVLSGGDVVSPVHVKRLLEARGERVFVNGYGPTETTTFACCHRVTTAADVESPLPIGRPIANTTAYLLDGDLPVGPGEIGEICIGGDGVARGYLNRPVLTEERFVPDPFTDREDARLYRTGDLGRFRSDGTIEFLGRADEQVKIRGFRIELGEIEHILLQLPGIREAAVLARDARGEKELVAYIVADGDVDSHVLRTRLADRIPDYMLPAAVVAINELPLTANGKIDRATLGHLRSYPPATSSRSRKV